MARTAKKKRDKSFAQKSPLLNPFKLTARVLATIGKPFYFVLSNLVIFFIFFLGLVGKLTIILLPQKSATHKPLYKKVKAVKQKREISKIDIFIKLEGLRLMLLRFRVLAKFKLAGQKFSGLFKNRRLKLRAKLLLPALFLLVILAAFYFAILKDLPSPNELIQREPEVSTKIYDRNGNVLYKIYKEKNRTIVPLTNIPMHVRLATLAAEDAEFYDHPGFSIKGILRALSQDFTSGNLQGGSTITQQLVKNVLLSPEKTLTRKIRELILSIRVEANYTKDQILEMYLNEVSYGGTAYGIQEASESYFGKNVADITLAEAAFLAGLPKSPTVYSPFGQNPDLAFERQREVLKLMRINKFINAETEKQALSETLRFTANRTEINAPHFVMYIKQLLVDKYGEDVVEKGGLEVTTSLDLGIQKAAETIVKNEVDRLKGLNVGNGASLVLDPNTGEILAMVGSKDYFDVANDGQVNVLTRLRQPGSAIKVINYAYALSNGFTPASVIDDSPITYVVPGSRPYSPVNYDGTFRGKTSLRNSLAQSRNVPAVKILASYGVQKMIDLGQKMGITTWNDSSKYGLSLTLGGGSIKGIDLAKVFATIANEGNSPEIIPILEVKNYKGKVLEANYPQSERVLDERVAYILTDILKDNIARSPEFGLNSYLVIKNHPEVAVKTGTSNDLRDNWTVGFNQNFLVLTWVGNNDNSPMSRIASGITGASPIWNKIMTTLLSDEVSVDWKVPDNISRINICSITGTLPCNGCPTRQEWFLDETKPTRACSIQQIEAEPNSEPFNRILDSGISI